MPVEKFPTPEINLLPGEDLDTRPGGRLLKWALTWGKRIIIVTELVVILAFLSRFKLDTDSASLTESINGLKVVLENEASFEAEFRAISDRISKTSSLLKKTSLLSVLTQASSLIPSSVTISNLAVNGLTVNFSGTGTDQALSQMIAAFKQSPDFLAVDMQKVAKKGDAQLVDFSLSASFSPKNP